MSPKAWLPLPAVRVGGLPCRRPSWVLDLLHPRRRAQRSAGPDQGAADSLPAARPPRQAASGPTRVRSSLGPGPGDKDLLGAVRAHSFPPTPLSARRETAELSFTCCGSLFVRPQVQVETPPGPDGTAEPVADPDSPGSGPHAPPGGPRLGAPVPRFPAGRAGRGRGVETPEPPLPRGKSPGPEVGSPQGRGRRIRVSARRPRLPRAAARAAAAAAAASTPRAGRTAPKLPARAALRPRPAALRRPRASGSGSGMRGGPE